MIDANPHHSSLPTVEAAIETLSNNKWKASGSIDEILVLTKSANSRFGAVATIKKIGEESYLLEATMEVNQCPLLRWEGYTEKSLLGRLLLIKVFGDLEACFTGNTNDSYLLGIYKMGKAIIDATSLPYLR
jgi:hypothetical protein